jgi:hypothetical protein
VSSRGSDRPAVHPFAGAAEQAENLGRLLARAAEPVRRTGVELGHLPLDEHAVTVPEDQAQVTGNDVQPLVPLVAASSCDCR